MLSEKAKDLALDQSDLIIHGRSVDAMQACTSRITSMCSWFFNKTAFNKDITH